MPWIYAPHEYCVKRVRFSQVAEGCEAKAIDFDLVVTAGDSFETHTNRFTPRLSGHSMTEMTFAQS